MFCVHCGKAHPDDAKFCPFCGKSATVQASSTPASPPVHESPSAPIELSNPTLPPEQNAPVPAPEPDVTSEVETSPVQETSTSAPKTTVKYRVTFMRWDTSGPELTITFSQDDPITISSGESRTVTLPGGTQHISLDTASQHLEFEISLDTDIKVNLRWDADSSLFSADCSTREPFKFTATTPAAEPASPSASTSVKPSSHIPSNPPKSAAESAPPEVSGKKPSHTALILAAVLAVVVVILVAFFLSQGSDSTLGDTKPTLEDKVQYLDSLTVTDVLEGTTELRVYFRFTNTTDEITSPNFDMSVVAFQNGVSLSELWDNSDWGAMLQPGASIDVYRAFDLPNEASPVEVVVYGSFTQEGPHYSITIDPSIFGIPDKENTQDTLNTYNTPDPVDEYPYYLANDMDDILNVDLWGETAFLDAVDEGWGWDWLWNYTALGSADVDYVPEPLWYNESLGEWTIYGVTYDHACDVGWGSAWLQLMSEMS